MRSLTVPPSLDLPATTARTLRAPWYAVAAAVWVVAYAVGLGVAREDGTLELVLRDGIFVLPIALAFVLAIRAAVCRSGATRVFWSILAASNALWLFGELVWGWYEVGLHRDPPFPSVADALYVSSYVLVVPAVLLGFRTTSVWRAARGLLDASIVVVAVGVSGWLVLIAPQLTGGWSLATATGVAYPLLGVLIVMVLVLVAFGGTVAVPRSIAIVAVAFAVTAVTDGLYTYTAVLHDIVDGKWLNVGWQAEAVLLCVGAHLAAAPRERTVRRGDPARDRGLPIVGAGIAVTAVVVSLDGGLHGGALSLPVMALMGYSVLALLTRLQLTSIDKDAIARELHRSLAQQEHLALTDPLTELHNRRAFELVLQEQGARAQEQGSSLAVAVIDLDHFKRINDSFGHQTGDAVLRIAARRLAEVVRPGDVLARYGGEEFVVVLPGADTATVEAVGERCRLALGATPVQVGDALRIRVTASVGAAVMPTHATTTDDLVRTADSALYLAKRLGRNQTRVGSVLFDDGSSPVAADNRVVEYLQVLADDIDSRQAAQEHSLAMARWTARIAERLELTEEQTWRAVLAARLHDIGKVAVPDAILRKPGPLAEEEWRIIRDHPEQGARLVALDPLLTVVAEAIRDHHERPDGLGYPAGKRAGEITIEARVISVCDAWAAMRATRRYRPALALEDAREQLREGRGSQFDPAVVDAFLTLEQDGIVGGIDTPAAPEAAAAALR